MNQLNEINEKNELSYLNLHTVNPQKRPAGLILSLRVQMRVLLEFGPNLSIFAYCFLSALRVLFECGSYSFSERLNVGLIRIFVFLPIVF